MDPAKFSPELLPVLEEMQLASMHPEQLPPDLERRLRRTAQRRGNDGEWLLVESSFAKVYMSALAALLAKETDLAALTNEELSMGVNLRTLLEDLKPSTQSEKKGALVSFVMEAIRVDPETRIDKLLAFRQSRHNQLAELTKQFDAISAGIANYETARELEERVRDAYVTQIRPRLESLKDELNDNFIAAVWDGVQRVVTVSVPAAGAVAYFTGLTGTTLLAAGAAIAVTDVAVKTHLAHKRTRRASPYSYLLDIEHKFCLPTT